MEILEKIDGPFGKFLNKFWVRFEYNLGTFQVELNKILCKILKKFNWEKILTSESRSFFGIKQYFKTFFKNI